MLCPAHLLSLWCTHSTHHSHSHCVPIAPPPPPSLWPPPSRNTSHRVPSTLSARSNLRVGCSTSSSRPPSKRCPQACWLPSGPVNGQGPNTRSTSVGERASGLTGSDHLFKNLWFHNLMVLPPFLGLFPHVLLKINMAMNSEALGILPSSSPRWELGGFPARGGLLGHRAGSPHPVAS